MKKDSMRKTLLIISFVLIIVNFLEVDFDSLLDFKKNKSPFLGILSMSLLALSMFLSIDKNSNKD